MLFACSLVPLHNAIAGTRSISVSPAAFLRNSGSSNILLTSYLGLRWLANNSDRAGFYQNRPADWDRITAVKVHLTFALGGNTAGAVNWRMFLNTYTPGSGEWLTNPGSRNADTILTFPSGPSWYRIYSQTFTIQAAQLNTEPMWSIFFERGNAANSETFAGDLYVMDATVGYNTKDRTAMFPLVVPSSP